MESKITINVSLDEKKMPKQISWQASESTAEQARPAKAMIFPSGMEMTVRLCAWIFGQKK